MPEDLLGGATPTPEAIERVRREGPSWWTQANVLNYIAAAHRGNLICLDCGSENHTRGHVLCNYVRFDPEPQPTDGPEYHADHAAWSRRNPGDTA